MASPSTVDTRNISDCVRRSHHALNGFVMVVVGRAALPDCMFVSICDRSSVHELARWKEPAEGVGARIAAIRSVAARPE